MTMMCAQCYLNGRRVPVGLQPSKSPPFAFMVYNGESLCVDHLPEPARVDIEHAAFTPVSVAEFETFTPVPEKIESDSRFVVNPATPVKSAPGKQTQRKRTKS